MNTVRYTVTLNELQKLKLDLILNKLKYRDLNHFLSISIDTTYKAIK